MDNIISGLKHGMVVETDVKSVTGKLLYSDFKVIHDENGTHLNESPLSTAVKFPVVGIAAAVGRVALGIIHTLGHLFAAMVTLKKGHLFHAAKGACETLKGIFEAIPLAGRIHAFGFNLQNGHRPFWMMKIYNPKQPDEVDHTMKLWTEFPEKYYIRA